MPGENEKQEPFHLWLGRRDFLIYSGWTAFLGCVSAITFGTVRFFFPKVLFEPPSTFKAGRLSEYAPGTVSTKYKEKHSAWIVRDSHKLYALSAVCTHLGCTPNWSESENKFKCPCHGSGFDRAGINFEGPAPRPLERFKIALGGDGQIIVDKSKAFRYERGQWDDPASYLSV